MEDRSWQALYVTNDVWVTDSLEVSNLDIYVSRYTEDGVLISFCYRPLEPLQCTGWWPSLTPVYNKYK